MSTLTIDLTSRLWLTANRPIANHGMKARIVRDLHALVQDIARNVNLPATEGRVAITWTIHYPKGVRTDKGDPTNAHPTCKAILDALVPEWLEDDGPRFVVSETYKRGPNLDEPRWHRVVLELMEVAA
jgi:hypothetical protein